MSSPVDAYQQIARDLACVEMGADGRLGLHVTSDSMAPLLRPGDMVMAQRVMPEALRRGDLIVVRRPDDLITHRLVAVEAQGCLTKGDNCHFADAPVPAQTILGRVVAIKRGDLRVDLTSRRWAVVNRWLGELGWWEARLSRRFNGGGPAGNPPSTRWVAVFFRILTRAILFLPLKV
jgi:signal peptidase I